MLFYIDNITRQRVSYDQLLIDIQSCQIFNHFCKESDYYQLFLNLVLSLLIDEELILVDEDMSVSEVDLQLTDITFSRKLTFSEIRFLQEIRDVDHLFNLIINTKEHWRVALFTSGTTGIPKRITHSFESITRAVKSSEYHKADIWGFAYSPTHMAGLQVFFQALLNRNTIVRLFKYAPNVIISEINAERITHLSATPTFYRLLLSENRACTSVKRLTSGGERFDTNTGKRLNQLFPNAKITNVYASTEAGSVLVSDGDCFVVKQDILSLVKLVDGELWLHRKLMGESDALSLIENEWYATGDLVEIIEEVPLKIRFLNRKNEMINVGGFKVNPSEVEDAILKVDGVADVIVYAKKNSVLGSIVCAEVIKEEETLSEVKIREALQSSLQEFKIPRVIKFVPFFELTRTGKTKRK